MYCSKCGKELSGKEKFCPKCGNVITENGSQEAVKKQHSAEIEKGEKNSDRKKHRGRNLLLFVLCLGILAFGCASIYNFILSRQYEYLAVVQNQEGKYGYINEKGRGVIACEYDIAYEFSENGLAIVGYLKEENGETNEKLYEWYCIDSSGEKVIDLSRYTYVEECFSDNGLLAVATSEFSWGFINSKGETVVPCEYYSYLNGWNNEGLIAMSKLINDVPVDVAVNERGEEVFLIGAFGSGYNLKSEEGLYPVVDPDEFDIENPYGWFSEGYVDKEGKVIIPYEYAHCSIFSENSLAPVCKKVINDQEAEYKWGYINKSGETIIPFKYESAGVFADNGLAVVTVGQDDLSGYQYINESGSTVIECEDDIRYSGKFCGGLAVISTSDDIEKRGSYGLIDSNGNEVLECIYQDIELDESGQYGRVWYDADDDGAIEMGYINAQGDFITEIMYKMGTEFGDNGWAAGILEGNVDAGSDFRCIYIDQEGKTTLELSENYVYAERFIKV